MRLTARTVRFISTIALCIIAFSEELPAEIVGALPPKYHHWFVVAVAAANAVVSVLAIERHPATGAKITQTDAAATPPPAAPKQ